MRLPLVLVILVAACGSGGGDTPDAVDDTPSEFTRLIGRTWTVPAGNFDTYKCIRIQVPEDMYVTSFRTVAPPGSHHAVLTISRADNLTLGEYDCSVAALDLQMLYASGV